MIDAKSDFGCAGDSTYDPAGTGSAGTDDTAAMLAFFNHCIDYRVDGYIPAGVYAVNWGALAFDNGHADTNWPNIYTAGESAVIFVGTGTVDAPMMKITNGTASAADDKTWHGGCLGGFTVGNIEDLLLPAPATNRDALQIYGMHGTQFGAIIGYDLQGSVLRFPAKLFGATNPDPYHVAFCSFDAVEGYRVDGWTIRNENYLGWNFCEVGIVRGISNLSGVLYGVGGANIIWGLSTIGCKGWAIDDGANANALGGAPHIFYLFAGEFDNPQYGIRINRLHDGYIRGRFNHRKNWTALNTDNACWPLKCVDLAGGTSGNCSNLEIILDHRIDETSGQTTTHADLGVFVDMHNSSGGINEVEITHRVTDNIGISVVDDDLWENANPNNRVIIKRLGKVLLDTMPRHASGATVTPNFALKDGNHYAATTGIIPFNTERWDECSEYSVSTYGYTAPQTGRLFAQLAFPVTAPAGTRIRLGILVYDGSTYSLAASRIFDAPSNDLNHYQLDQDIPLTKGSIVYATADHNAGTGNITVSGVSSSAGEVLFQVRML